MQIGDRLRSLIRESGMMLVEVAYMSGIGPETLSTYLAGRRHPSLWTLVRICCVLNISVDDCLNGVEEWEQRRQTEAPWKRARREH